MNSTMDKRTQERLYRDGVTIHKGDREAGIWIVPTTRYYAIGDTGYIHLRRGQRLKASWEFDGDDWCLVVVHTDTILPASRRRRPWYRLRSRYSLWLRLIWLGLVLLSIMLLLGKV